MLAKTIRRIFAIIVNPKGGNAIGLTGSHSLKQSVSTEQRCQHGSEVANRVAVEPARAIDVGYGRTGLGV